MSPNQEPFESDPHVDALLDEVLGPDATPGSVPGDLADRIVAQTVDRLPGRQRGVIARIGPHRIRAVAAALIVAASIGIVLTGLSIFQESSSNIRQDGYITLQKEFVKALETPPTHRLDQEIELLAMQIDQFGSAYDGNGDSWSLEDEIDEYEVQFGSDSSMF